MSDPTRLAPRITAVLNEAVSPFSDAELAEANRKQELAEQANWHNALKAVIGDDHGRALRAVLAGPGETPAIGAVRDWLEKPRAHHLMLRGGTGCGKTVAAVFAVREWVAPLAKRGKALWLSPDTLVSAMLHAYADDAPKLTREHKLVVVDDIGIETKGQFTTALSRLLDRDGVHVLMTCNLLKDAMRQAYGDNPRLLDRLRGSTFAVDVPGGSQREPVGDF